MFVPSQVKANESLQSQLRPNLAANFLAALALGLAIKTVEPHGLPENVTPEQVLAYIYAVLHAPSYRSRYGPFLESDFPRIPIGVVEKSLPTAMNFIAAWEALLPLGENLTNLHLLNQVPDALSPTFPQQGNNTVEKPRYEAPKQARTPATKGAS